MEHSFSIPSCTLYIYVYIIYIALCRTGYSAYDGIGCILYIYVYIIFVALCRTGYRVYDGIGCTVYIYV